MPTYEYACRECGHHLEVVQSFKDDPLTVCPTCSAEALRKVFHPIGISFKGSGFYKTDSRSSSSSGASSSSSSSSSGEKGDKGDSGGSGGSGGKKAEPASSSSPAASGQSSSSSSSTAAAS